MSIYKKSKDGTHFYRLADSVITHVLVNETGKDLIREQQVGNLFMSSICENNSYLINNISNLPDNSESIDSDKEEFENAMRQAIFGLGIYKYTA